LSVGSRGAEPEPDELIHKARDKLYTQRNVAIHILENSVKRSPQNVAYWSEYVYALNVDGRFYFAERASRESLRIHPNDPLLLMARARILQPAPALDVLELLEKQPGHAEEARQLKELVRLGLGVPKDWDHPHLYVVWADRSMYFKRWDRAMQVLEEGLEKVAAAKELVDRGVISEHHGYADPAYARALRERKAMALVMTGKLDQGMEFQKASGYPQVGIDGSHKGIGDCLLDSGEPQLAVQSFGGKLPKKGEPQRRVLAWAYAEIGDFEMAEQLLKGRDTWTQLLLLRALLAAGENRRARRIGAKFVRPLGNPNGGSQWLYHYQGAVSLEREHVKAVEWLVDSFPEKKQDIEYAFGARVEPMKPATSFIPKGIPSSQLIPQLRDRLSHVSDPREVWNLRCQLASACAAAGRYAEAADAIQPEALRLSPPPHDHWTLGLNPTVSDWSLYRRRVDADALHEKNPRLLASARVLLDDIKAARWNWANPEGRKRFSEEEVVERLASIGPGVLSSVIDDLAPNAATGQDRSPYVEVIRRVGGAQDAPILLNVLCIVSLDPYAWEPAAATDLTAKELATEKAVHECLEKLTGTKNPETSRLARAEFWARWWRRNAERVILGKANTP
jgi:tetratricopeptide (TPR) repeat protein